MELIVASARRCAGVLVLALALVAAPGQTAAVDAAAARIDRTDRAAVVGAYKNRLAPALATAATFSGNVSTCNPGTESAASRTATMNAVNYYRDMAGLPPVTNNSDWNPKAQRAALMMDAQNDLSHYPQDGWKCLTADGAEAAGKSNIALGVAGARSIAAYMKDDGYNNAAVGHRRWILYPPTTEVGTGSTTRANALWVIDPAWATTPPARPTVSGGWVAWPSAGYVPWEALPHADAAKTLFRWSLSSNAMPDADYSQANITMKYGSNALVVQEEWVEDGPGDNTLVWSARRANGGRFPIEGDAAFVVTVSGIRNAGTTLPAHTYTVRAVRAVPDTTAPAAPGFPQPWGGVNKARVDWYNPRTEDLKGVEVRIRRGNTAPTRTDGTRVCKVLAPKQSCTATGLVSGVNYTFSTFAFDYAGNYSKRSTGALHGSQITARTSTDVIRRGDSVRIKGTLYYDKAGNVILSGRDVLLQGRTRRTDGSWGAWDVKAADRTGSSGTSWGKYSMKHAPRRTTQYRVIYQGTRFQAGCASPTRTVTVR